MADNVLNVVLGLVASAISAGLGWLAQTLRRRRRVERVRRFFGLPTGSDCLIVVNRQPASTNAKSVSRTDVYALMELAALVKECGSRAELVAHDEVRQGLGSKAEFCIGGPASNERTAAHLASWLPGVAHLPTPDSVVPILTIGSAEYPYVSGSGSSGGHSFALIARLQSAPDSRPAFLVSGLTATANQAGVRYLVAHHRELARKYGQDGTFALVLRVVNPEAYGPDMVELAADVTTEALHRPSAPAATTTAA
ncbi:hypothetical protein [Streptomyces sp. NRRL WC-3742]|uniref:hypothetical protein n=1 Tax=Streptomyces sp. NRRL WC-3742 TaxID=1463934 RepID=UPI0004C923F4|nr:hypothetical protein [Streptomyces sp. NRRL WC-3742]